jgi:hypothetical protein
MQFHFQSGSVEHITTSFIDWNFKNAVTCISDYRRGLDWSMDLLTPYCTITINYKNSKSIFSRTLLPWLPSSRPILLLVLRLTSEKVKVKVKVTLRLAVYRQSVCFGFKPFRPTTRDSPLPKKN